MGHGCHDLCKCNCKKYDGIFCLKILYSFLVCVIGVVIMVCSIILFVKIYVDVFILNLKLIRVLITIY